VDDLAPFITDSIWLGKMNKVETRLRQNGFWEDPNVQEMALDLADSQTDGRILALYERLKDRPLIRWKESIKAVVGLEIPTEAGLDI